MQVAKCPPPPKVRATPVPNDPFAALLDGPRRAPDDLQRYGYETTIDSARPFQVSDPLQVSESVAIAICSGAPGGWTTATIIDVRAGCVVGYGVARCNPEDEWDGKRGFEIAYGRAYRQAFGR